MVFSDVRIGEHFYDPVSQETFRKVSGTEAVMVSGEADGAVGDEFDQDEPVMEDLSGR